MVQKLRETTSRPSEAPDIYPSEVPGRAGFFLHVCRTRRLFFEVDAELAVSFPCFSRRMHTVGQAVFILVEGAFHRRTG